MKKLFLLYFSLMATLCYSQTKVTVSGAVSDGRGEKIVSGYVQLVNLKSHKIWGDEISSNSSYKISDVAVGEYVMYAYSDSYTLIQDTISITSNLKKDLVFRPMEITVGDVKVTASESKGLTSSSKIDRTAMRHLQPTSFTDILELLPGGKSVDPVMGSPNFISLRESSSTDMSSLGVSFMIDGTVMSNDANLQNIYNSTSSSTLSTISKGIDMRTIQTDNIESVEVIRGIPTAEYGDLTSGLVLINRTKTASKLNARFKSDQYSKLFSVGKGFAVGDKGDVVNVDGSYLNSYDDPRNTLENYKRTSASMRWNGRRELTNQRGSYNWTLSGDYTGSFDNAKTDADITQSTDLYESSYNKYSAAGAFTLRLNKSKLLRTLKANVSASREVNLLEQVKFVSLNKPTAIPVLSETGEADGVYLPYTYTTSATMEGIPVYVNAKLESDSHYKLGATTHTIKLGAEWNMSRNDGVGETIDPALPITNITSSVSRPRDFSEIPSVNKLSFYATDNINYYVNGHKLTASLGLRGSMLTNLSSEYALCGKMMLDPRVNLMWNLPNIKGWNIYLSAGLGYLSKLPTTSQLYPATSYYDIAQLNYYHNDAEHRLINYMTYAWDNTNYNLVAARNKKYELRLGFSKEGNDFSISYFNETMTNGFGSTSYYKIFDYKKYDSSSIDGNTLVGTPDLSTVSYTNESLIDTFTQVDNIANTYKTGIEFQFSSKRIESLKTRITVNGAWFKTRYSTDAVQYKGTDILINNNQVAYVGLYQWEDGTIYQNLNTNTILDTYLERIGMIFSVSFQCTWFKSYQSLYNDGVPFAYVDITGTEHVFTEADKTDTYLQNLVYSYSESIYDRVTTPFSMDINLKATKNVGQFMNIALFVNRIIGVYPDYYRGNTLVRRSSSPYFGMELNFRL